MSLGERLRLWIDVRAMTVRDFSKLSGIPYRSLHEYLSGERKPGADHLEKMSNIGIDVDWLLTGVKRSSVTWDFTKYADNFKGITGIVAADEELSSFFLESAIQLIDEWIMEHPESIKEMGLHGWVASAVSLWTTYANAANNITDHIIKARKAGASVQDVAGHIVTTLRPFLLERMKLLQPPPESVQDQGPN